MGDDDGSLDPRIQIELENLNTATDEINRLEIALDEANTTFRILLNECTRRLKVRANNAGNSIEKARPYYDALEDARLAQQECQRAAAVYHKSNECHQAAKEAVTTAEQKFLGKQHEGQFDNASQEILNHAIIKVREAETKKAESGREHQKRTLEFKAANERVQQLEKSLNRHILKSRPYFEEKALCDDQLTTQKERVETLHMQVTAVKNAYAASLKELEQISEEIHCKRSRNKLSESDPPNGPREPGVGAEISPVFSEVASSTNEKNKLQVNSSHLAKDQIETEKQAIVENEYCDVKTETVKAVNYEKSQPAISANQLPLLDVTSISNISLDDIAAEKVDRLHLLRPEVVTAQQLDHILNKEDTVLSRDITSTNIPNQPID